MNFAIEIIEPRVEILNPTVEEWPNLFCIVERCGRVSHKSEGRMGDGTSGAFVNKIACHMRHESILEHSSITALFVGSRAMSHQLVRHRIAAYTQESMRYCDYSKGDTPVLQVVCPPSVWPMEERTESLLFDARRIVDLQNPLDYSPLSIFIEKTVHSYDGYLKLREHGVPAEDARFLLPTATKTEVAVTFNLRMWLHFFKMRCDKHAQWEIRQLACTMQDLFKKYLPEICAEETP